MTALNTPPIGQKTLSVSELNRFVKNLLDLHLPLIWVEGEISNFSAPSSGHWYFSLKDENAQVRCAMFKGRNLRVGFKPKAGTKVRIRAKASLYEGRGEYQIIAEHMEDAGFGVLQQRYEALKKQLHQEGLFDETRKEPLPSHAAHIGVITSPTGAAITDVLSVIKRRFASQKISIIPTSVQGENAPQEIIQALTLAQQANSFDVILLCRGGGSIEDLWAFNSEKLARFIAQYPLPIVSAVGHEIDFTIADFVADMRAPTPSAAAEILTPNQDEISSSIRNLKNRLIQAHSNIIRSKISQVDTLSASIKHPLDKLNATAQRLDHLEQRLINQVTQALHQAEKRFNTQHNKLQLLQPSNVIYSHNEKIKTLHARLTQNMLNTLKNKQQHFASAASLLDIASPLATLKRGYAIVKDDTQKVISQSQQVKTGDNLSIQLADGELSAKVTKVNSH